MKKITLSIILLISILIEITAVNSLKVSDPKTSWYSYQGTIENAIMSVRPKGIYLEYGLYLTFSSRGTYLISKKDTLEVVLNFDLPEGAIVQDSWLWIGDDIIKAKLLDKWTASSIYEGIVKRRKDPSILSKLSATQYELRVFPMVGNETRKVKITYMLPISWNKGNISAGLPNAILNTSKNVPNSLYVLAWADSVWKSPKIIDDETIQFTNSTDSIFGSFSSATISSSKFSKNLKIGYNNPIKEGFYFSSFKEGNEGIYQLSVLPSEFLDSSGIKKTAILIDYDVSNTVIGTNELLNSLKTELINNLTEKDSFNLIFSNLTISRYSEKWVSASKTNIENAFSSLNNPLSNYSNLPSLLGNGVDFIKKNGNDGKILLLSNSDNYGEYQIASTLINDLVASMNPKIQIHISDYQSQSFPNYNIGIYTYYGNEYLYSNLSRITLGSYHRVKNGLSVNETISGSFKYLSGAITSFDIHTRMQNGFCHSRYNITGGSNVAYLNDPIIQIGKFKGSFPFIIDISGEYNNKVFSRSIEIKEEDAFVNDSISRKIWTGQYIKELETGIQSNNIINEIIFNSLNERILSLYTSFLCLEDNSMICQSCLDESRLVGLEDFDISKDSVTIYPNPFRDQVTIELYCTTPENVSKLAIYNATGILVFEFDTSKLVEGNNKFTWDGKNQNSGVYLLVYKDIRSSRTIKLIKR